MVVILFVENKPARAEHHGVQDHHGSNSFYNTQKEGDILSAGCITSKSRKRNFGQGVCHSPPRSWRAITRKQKMFWEMYDLDRMPVIKTGNPVGKGFILRKRMIFGAFPLFNDWGILTMKHGAGYVDEGISMSEPAPDG